MSVNIDSVSEVTVLKIVALKKPQPCCPLTKVIRVLTCCKLAGEGVTVPALSGIWTVFGCNLSSKGNDNKKSLPYCFFFQV